jgi:F-type H+-transporting ATPase subunit epsilon
MEKNGAHGNSGRSSKARWFGMKAGLTRAADIAKLASQAPLDDPRSGCRLHGLPMKLEIVTPEQRVELGNLKAIVFQSLHGETGILPGHIPMICQIDIGRLTVTDGSRQHRFVTGSGMARIHGDHVVFLLMELVAAEEIDPDLVRRHIEQIENTMAKSRFRPDSAIPDDSRDELRYARAQLDLAAERIRG